MDFQALLQATLARKQLSEEQIRAVVWRVQAILAQESNVLSLHGPINICGDLHGQFYDVRKLFEVGGKIEAGTRYLFLGDYVDRGYFSLETVTLLFLYKLLYPDQIFLLRGNHECRSITQVYGFYEQCMRYYAHSAIWKLFVDAFDFLPVSAIVDGKIFCIHGGLSPKCPAIDSVRTIQRSIEVPSEGPFTDLLWSDPETKVSMFSPSTRGAGFLFGAQAVEKFCGENNIELVTRAHQLAPQGYQHYFGNKCLTIWSCPNYFYKCRNLAAVMEVRDSGIKFVQFDAVPDSEREKPEWAKK